MIVLLNSYCIIELLFYICTHFKQNNNMITGNEGYIIDVIADLQKRLASATASNDYLRKVNQDLEYYSKKLKDENLELASELKTCHETIDGKNDLILACDKLLAEQKETIETLQSSVQTLTLKATHNGN